MASLRSRKGGVKAVLLTKMKNNLMNVRGFSLIEVMLVLLIFTFLFGAILTVMTTQGRSWRIGYDKVTAQQEARKAVDEIARLLRQSNPDWGSGHSVDIPTDNRIDFWQPLFDAAGAITTLRKVTFKLNPDNIRQLLKKEGQLPEVVVANDVDSVNFGGGCAGCAAFNCTGPAAVAMDCPVVTVEIKTRKLRQVFQVEQFSLSSQVTLRNTNVVAGDVVIEEPEEGEF